MGIENLNTDLSAKQALLKKANYALEKNGADINDNDVEINANSEEQVSTSDNITSTSGEITTVKKDKSGIKGEIDALKDCLDNDNADEELRKERLLQIKDLEVNLNELNKLEDELNKKKDVEENKLKKQKADKQVLEKKNETLKTEKKDLEQQKVQAEQEVKKAEQEELLKKEQPVEKNDSTISNTQSTFNSVAGTLISNYADDAIDLLEVGSKAGKVLKATGKAAGFVGSAIDAGGAVADYARGTKTGTEAAEAVGWVAADVAASKLPLVGAIASTIGTENLTKEYLEHKKEFAKSSNTDTIKDAISNGEYGVATAGIVQQAGDLLTGGAETIVLGAVERKITSVVEEFSPEAAQTIHNGWTKVETLARDPKALAGAVEDVVDGAVDGAKTVAKKGKGVAKSVVNTVSSGINKAKNTAKTVVKKVAKTVLPTSVYNTASSAYHKIKSWF